MIIESVSVFRSYVLDCILVLLQHSSFENLINVMNYVMLLVEDEVNFLTLPSLYLTGILIELLENCFLYFICKIMIVTKNILTIVASKKSNEKYKVYLFKSINLLKKILRNNFHYIIPIISTN